jgi:hypothetical protein
VGTVVTVGFGVGVSAAVGVGEIKSVVSSVISGRPAQLARITTSIKTGKTFFIENPIISS